MLGLRDDLVILHHAGASFTHLDREGDGPHTVADNVMACLLGMDTAKFRFTWFSIMMLQSYSFSELLGRTAPLRRTCSSFLPRMPVIHCRPDVLVASEQPHSALSSKPCLGKSPQARLEPVP